MRARPRRLKASLFFGLDSMSLLRSALAPAKSLEIIFFLADSNGSVCPKANVENRIKQCASLANFMDDYSFLCAKVKRNFGDVRFGIRMCRTIKKSLITDALQAGPFIIFLKHNRWINVNCTHDEVYETSCSLCYGVFSLCHFASSGK